MSMFARLVQATKPLSELEARGNCRPHGNVERPVPYEPTYLPTQLAYEVVGEMPETTREQLNVLEGLGDSYDEVGPCELRRNGWLTVRLERTDPHMCSRDVCWLDISPDGIPYDIENREDAA